MKEDNNIEESEIEKGVRLQKYLASCGVASRRKSEILIKEGRVTVNGVVVTKLGTRIDSDNDLVRVNQNPIKKVRKGVVLFNKPREVISTLDDPRGRRSIQDYLGKKYNSYFPAGRLDWDSSGLIVLTNDGELADRIMHPKYGIKKTYHVRAEGRISETIFNKLTRGIKLDDGPIKAFDIRFIKGDEKSTWFEITIKEGRNRVIRRMMDAVEHSVIKLKRVSHGPFKLGSLPVGRMRPLTEKEYSKARTIAFRRKAN